MKKVISEDIGRLLLAHLFLFADDNLDFKQFVCVRFDEGVPILKVLLYNISRFTLENTTSPAYCIYLT